MVALCCAAVTVPADGAAKKKASSSQSSKKSSSKSSKSSSKSGSKSTRSSSKSSGGSSKNSSKSKTNSKSSKGKKAANERKSSRRKSSSKNTRKDNGVRRAPRVVKTPAPPKEVASNDSLTLRVNQAVLSWIPKQLNPGGLRVNSVRPDATGRIANVRLNENFTYLPVTRNLIDSLSITIKDALPDSLSGCRVSLSVNNKPLAYYITRVDKLPEKYRKNIPFVTEVNPVSNAKKGMPGDILALWASHGRYFRPGADAWMWQRPMLFQAMEDTYTLGYVYPYLVPMLENAGAYVFMPRERDTNNNEVIVDNDLNQDGKVYSQPYYKEMNGSTQWTTGELDGFIYDLPDFRDTENPFENGTYRQTTTVRSGKPSVAAWYADIPASGEYAVYVSYKSLPNSTEDARYTVNYSGGSKEFKVNQTMGGGTWIYLGTFPIEKGYSDSEPIVTLSNISDKDAGKIITADAVKIGGGMGNIARSARRSDIYYDPSTPESNFTSTRLSQDEEGDDDPDDDDDDNDSDDDSDSSDDDVADGDGQAPVNAPVAPQKKGPSPKFSVSGMPRWVEGARYWLQWAGFPENVYSPYHGADDYKDDYTGRGHWVNYLAGGSRVLPNRQGLKIPVDLSFALHSDAGVRSDDSFVGTLGIYYTNNGASYADGTPRINSRMLTDLIMRQITGDVRMSYEPNWTRRSMWDKSYVEARVPEVPTTLIELMSHQNFADMMYGNDPNFRFTVGRAIYKAMARFMAERKGREVVIQPLPVKEFAIQMNKPNHYRLSWSPTPDPLEKTAMPSRYIIMERTEGDLGFHRIAETSSTHYEVKVTDNKIHSFRIIAVNDGGSSFPSETLALCNGTGGGQPMLVVNGFDRVSGPKVIREGGKAGFAAEEEFGVPYIKDMSFTGYQQEFNRSAGVRHGNSSGTYVPKVIAGNTFDYAAIHGDAFAETGLGFVSCSAAAVEKGIVKLSNYKIIDWIAGKQKATVVGNGKSGVMYRTFTPNVQKELRKFVERGGHLLITGQYVASDLTGPRSSMTDRDFASEVLGIRPVDGDRVRDGGIRYVTGRTMDYNASLNDRQYIVENPDILEAADDSNATPVYSFSRGSGNAGFIHNYGKGKVMTISVPLEALTKDEDRDAVVANFLKY